MLFAPLGVGALILAFAAILSKRMSTAAGALIGLAVVLGIAWLLLVFMLGEMAAHYDASSWPSPMLLAGAMIVVFSVAAVASLPRKFR
jgi:hypothetical protein